MSEIQFYELKCKRCGGQLEQNGAIYKCESCGKIFEKQVVTDVADQLRAVLNEQKQEVVANLRQQLWAEMHEENINSEKVRGLARDIKKYLPNDYFANFCEIANSEVENNAKQINSFLNNTPQSALEDYADIVLDFMIKSLRTENITAIAQFIERAFKGRDNDEIYEKYTTWLESEADKIDKGIYDLDIPRDVFLAYSSADMDKVLEICEYLESNDISCFMALRNLRHGRDALHNYDQSLKTAIENCKTVVFVSSTNSRNRNCEAFTKELPYIKHKDLEVAPAKYRHDYSKLPVEYMMPRVEYVIEGYRGNVAEEKVREFFHGLEWCRSKEAVAKRVLDYLTAAPEPVEEETEEDIPTVEIPVKEDKSVKYCKKCCTANRKNAKFCSSCGSGEFFASFDEYLSSKTKYCASCGTQNNVEDKFCAECGSTKFVLTKKAYEDLIIKREEEERQRKIRDEQERKRREEEARNPLAKLGKYRDIGGGYITFGTYPQSKKASNVKIGEKFDTEYGYYLGSDNCLYAEWNGEYYKVEPIKWKLLKSESEQFIVADLILDQHRFDSSSNNYANSEIRSWLNGEFYTKMFTEAQRSLILTTMVDNSVASTGDSTNKYVCGNTNDKIFVLSNKEAEQYFYSDEARKRKATDYAKARGLYVHSRNGNSWWWHRSPCCDESDYAQGVGIDGDFCWSYVGDSDGGVLPALKIKLQASSQSEAEQAETRVRAEDERKRKLQEQVKTRGKTDEEANNSLVKLGNFKDLGNGYVIFGTYPQSKKADTIKISKLYDKVCGYYLGSDNCIYEEFKGAYYKVEPIKWKVLSRDGEFFMVSDMILDVHRFDDDSNNYANSEIRIWLNNDFYKKAFCEEQKSKIVTTMVDNSLSSTGESSNSYTCDNTSDKVFLLSRKETAQYFTIDSARQRKGTDYAKAKNLYIYNNNDNSYWYLRSPGYYDSTYAQLVDYDGIFEWHCVDDSESGVLPSLKIKL